MTPCLLCGSPDLTSLYQPIGTQRGIMVYLCPICGLLQSRPVGVKGDGIPRTSHNADYGNLRLGKIGRAASNLAFLRRNIIGFKPKRVLDVGASRGAFIKEFRQWLPDSQIDMIEPDTSLRQYWPPGNQVLWHKIEDIPLVRDYYNLIYLCHTLEHLDTPLDTLRGLGEIIDPDGWLLIEVPNIRGLMGILDVIEELYIDKHVCHFSLNTLRKMLGATGFHPLFYLTDTENLTILAQRGDVTPVKVDHESQGIRLMVQAYAASLTRNRKALKSTSSWLNKTIRNEGKPALISGGGRILSALIEAGLDPMLFEGIVDPWLPLDEVHGLPVLSNPKMIGYVKPKVILVCSRSSADTMAGEAIGWMPGVKVVRWNE